MADACATCGHDRAHHDPLPLGAGCLHVERCGPGLITAGCSCAKFERTQSAGADVTGPAEASPPASAGPPDLHQAIQAATNALVLASAAGSFPVSNWQVDSQAVARVAVEAAWSALVDAHDHQAHLLRVELADLTRRLDQADRNTFEALEQVQRLKGQVAEFRELLEQIVKPQPWGDFADRWTPLRTKIIAVLQAEGAVDA